MERLFHSLAATGLPLGRDFPNDVAQEGDLTGINIYAPKR
jgi:hypothetical protein